MTENILNRELVEEFREISQCDNNLKSYENYYQAYVKFVNEHKDNFTNSILEKWGLDVLTSIDIQKYIVPTPELSLVAMCKTSEIHYSCTFQGYG